VDRPGRLAAVGAAALVCALSVSGALGFSFIDGPAGASPRPSTVRSADTGSSANPAAHETPHVPTPGADSGRTSPDHPAGQGSGDRASSDRRSGDRGSGGTSRNLPPAVDPTRLPPHSGTGKRIVFDMSAQRVWLVGPKGAVVRTYPVSGSKYDNLHPDTYSVTSRSRYATAYNSNETLNFMVRFAFGRTAPIGFHAIPELPNGRLVEKRSGLGEPASDGCIRQWITDARALWDFAPVGTSVVEVA
jgi:hypothetical protein